MAATPETLNAATLPLTALSEDERMFQATVRKFAREQIRPYVREMDEAGQFRKDIIKQFFEMGLMGIEIPEEYGGQGGTFFQAILAVEELSAVDPSAGVIVDVQNTICNNALLRWATPEQKSKYLPRLAENTVASYALSEAGSGSDAFAMATRAEDHGDHFLLNGRKLWITNAAEAGFFLLFANANPEAGYKGVTAFLVEREFPGFQVGKKEDKLGLRASSTCELLLDNCRVPRENVMGDVGKGYKIAIETLNEGRTAIGAQMIGLARGALEYAIAYAPERKQFGKTIGEFQGVQFDLAKMAIQVEAARLLVYNAARLRDAGLPFLTEAAMAKYYSSEIAEQVASKAIEVHGGVGITRDYPVEKLYRDAKIGRIYEGTSNIQLLTIAKKLLGKEVRLSIWGKNARNRSLRRCRGLVPARLGGRRRQSGRHHPEICRQGTRVPASAQQLYLSPEREAGGSQRRREVGRGGRHHLHPGRQTHRKGYLRPRHLPPPDQPVSRGRAGSAQRAALRAHHARDPGLRHPVARQGKSRRYRLLHLLGQAQDEGHGQALLRRPDLGGRSGLTDRQDLWQRRRAFEAQLRPGLPQVRSLPRTDR